MANFNDHHWYMSLALEEAEKAYKLGEVPVGAVLVSASGEILAKTFNEKESKHDPCGHAEIIALRKAAKQSKSWRLAEAQLYVTLEPCVMCFGAIISARISHVYFGAYDMKGGFLSVFPQLLIDKKLNHQVAVMGGIKHYETSKMLSQFFKERRQGYHQLGGQDQRKRQG